MVKQVFKALDNMITLASVIILVIGVFLILSGHLDVSFSQGMKSVGTCLTVIK